jgi:hypothetical protein
MLKMSIVNERFEDAAKLRDEIKVLKSQVRPDACTTFRQDAEALNADLRAALAAERFEEAAVTRDKIRYSLNHAPRTRRQPSVAATPISANPLIPAATALLNPHAPLAATRSELRRRCDAPAPAPAGDARTDAGAGAQGASRIAPPAAVARTSRSRAAPGARPRALRPRSA